MSGISRDAKEKFYDSVGGRCLADNNNVTQPAASDVTIDMKRE
jgi:hypothetical protein